MGMSFFATALLVLTNLAEAISFHGSSQATNRFDFIGIVDNVQTNRLGVILNFTDGEGHYAAMGCPRQIASDVSEGDLVHAVGLAIPVANPLRWRTFLADEVKTLEHRGFRPYADTTTLTGTIAAVFDKDPEWYWMVLRTAEGRKGIVAKSANHPLARLKGLVDAEVEVSGVPYQTVGLYGAIVPHFSIRGKDSIKVLRPAPADPFDAPRFSAINLPHRQVLTGTVIGTTADRFALYCQSHMTVTVLLNEGQRPPRPYETVEVSGFVSSAPNVIADNAVYRLASPNPETPSLPDSRHSGTKKIIARVIGRSVADRRLFVTEGEGSLSVDLSALRDTLSELPEIDSKIEVSGYCFMEIAGASNIEVFPRLLGMTIAPRTPDEFKVIAGPPWWTPLRATLAIAILISLFFVIFYINRTRLKSKISERTRLATELHDYLAQDLTAISYQLTAAKRARQSGQDDSRALSTADRMLSSCRTELRRCLYDLRNDALDESDFARAVEITLRPLAKDVKCAVTLQFSRLPFDDTAAHSILSILRELLSNAVSHGRATRFSISGLIKDRQLVFTVRDNGCGFAPSSAPAQEEGHFGLSGVRERLRKLSGKITITSAPNEGTVITLSIPV